jgi:signal transduction histidine kinase
MRAKSNKLPSSAIYPMRVFAIIMMLIFAVEGAIMLAMPALPAWARTPAVASIVDASALALVMTPAIWWSVVNPIRRLSEARGHLLHSLLEAQEQERAHIARDLHDEVGQQLTALLVGLSTVESAPDLCAARTRAADLRRFSAAAHEEVRRLARGLLPGVLEELGLAAAIERLCEDYENTHQAVVRLHAPTAAYAELSRPVETALYRILQEALTNVARHADANSIDVTLARSGGSITLSIEDDGRGIGRSSPVATLAGRTSVGLDCIRERAQMLQGECTIRSAERGGTLVRVRIPLPH